MEQVKLITLDGYEIKLDKNAAILSDVLAHFINQNKVIIQIRANKNIIEKMVEWLMRHRDLTKRNLDYSENEENKDNNDDN
ncbi:hypothetical protein B4U79_19252, partial [Dinothrombium tinctorium]